MRARRVVAILMALTLFAAACGDDDSDGPSGTDGASGTDAGGGTDDGADGPSGDGAAGEDGKESSTTDGGAAGAPTGGPVVSLLTFEQGLFAIDRESGDARALEIPGVGYTERNAEPVRGEDGSVYTITYTPVAETDFTYEVGLARVDGATGAGALLTSFGQNRADDEATELTEWRLVGVTSSTAWVVQNVFGANSQELIGIELADGQESTRVAISAETPAYEPIVARGAVHAQVNGDIAVFDPQAGTWDTVLSFDGVSLGAFVDAADIGDYAVTSDGEPIGTDDVESVLSRTEPRPSGGAWVGTDDSIYWVFSELAGLTSGQTAVVGGAARLDLTTGEIEAVYPLGESVATWEEEGAYSALSQPTLQLLDGVLWIADSRENGSLLGLDVGSGELVVHEVPRDDGIDYTTIELLPTDPEGLWLLVGDWVIESDGPSEGRSSSGTSYIERFDPATGEVLLSLREADIIGF
ncbi:MAG: hypothetical protein KDB21_00580 [Acidimicrobiales bacterium]|nr:hypothetical protein [Acidimicrobiales bacterium]